MNISLLIVDDETVLPDLIRDFLDDETNFDVFIASSGEEGLEILDQQKMDICMVDMRLPGINGNEFIQRALEKYPSCKFIIHTGSIDYKVPRELLDKGIAEQSILFKPVTGLHLYLEKINELLSL